MVLFAACGEDPTAGDPICVEQPTVTVNDAVQGTLSEEDDRFAGALIDYYALQVSTTARFTVRLSSTEMNPLLLRFNELGEVTAQAFYAEGTEPGVEESPSITQSFNPGCHLLGASAFTPDTTGAYVLTVEEAGP